MQIITGDRPLVASAGELAQRWPAAVSPPHASLPLARVRPAPPAGAAFGDDPCRVSRSG